MREKMALVVICLALAPLPGFAQSAPSAAPLGLVAEIPTEGTYVGTDRGYMVPYQAEIPGTRISYTMIPVPGGTHQMVRDGVTYVVDIKPFWMGRTEVTWSEYREFMKLYLAFRKFEHRGLRKVNSQNEIDAVSAPSDLYAPEIVFGFGQDPRQPALGMRHFAARQYTKWLSLQVERYYRLPSEAEWEYACLAGSPGPYYFGSDDRDFEFYGWSSKNAPEQTGMVGIKVRNAFGLYDMHGNVAEWVLDGADSRTPLPAAGSKVSVDDSIAWAAEPYGRIAKGGSFLCEPHACKATSRLVSSEEWMVNDPDLPPSPFWHCDGDIGCSVGFRLLRPLQVPSRQEQEKMWSGDVPRLKREVQMGRDSGRHIAGIVDPQLAKDIKALPPGW